MCLLKSVDNEGRNIYIYKPDMHVYGPNSVVNRAALGQSGKRRPTSCAWADFWVTGRGRANRENHHIHASMHHASDQRGCIYLHL